MNILNFLVAASVSLRLDHNPSWFEGVSQPTKGANPEASAWNLLFSLSNFCFHKIDPNCSLESFFTGPANWSSTLLTWNGLTFSWSSPQACSIVHIWHVIQIHLPSVASSGLHLLLVQERTGVKKPHYLVPLPEWFSVLCWDGGPPPTQISGGTSDKLLSWLCSNQLVICQ